MTKTEYATKQMTLASWKNQLQKAQLNRLIESMKIDAISQRIREIEEDIEK